MSRFSQTAKDLKKLLDLEKEPVAISFKKEIPKDVKKYDGDEVPSGCTFWIKGQDSMFYTVASDHYNCPIGTMTQGFQIPEERMGEAMQLCQLMVTNKYLTTKEIENVPKVKSLPKAIVYGPLSHTKTIPDVVVFACTPYQAMLVAEAVAARYGEFPQLMGRPTCAAMPAAMGSQKVTLSLGCIGNRVYTEIGKDKMVVTIPGKELEKFLSSLKDIARANDFLETAHREKKKKIGGK